MKTDLAPLALFAYNRPKHTFRTLSSLSKNPEFNTSPLFIFCDGPRGTHDLDAVRATQRIAMDWDHPGKTVTVSESNRGLANSIIFGVTELTRSFGSVIVIEDDLELAPAFLGFMNRGLDEYSENEQVFHVSGYSFPVLPKSPSIEGVFVPLTSSWGWATWERAWKFFDPDMSQYGVLRSDRNLRKSFDLDGSYKYFRMLERQKEGKIDSWAIRWYLSVFMKGGLSLFPSQSLVRNTGFDGSGTHCRIDRYGSIDLPQGDCKIYLPKIPAVNAEYFSLIKRYQRKKNASVNILLKLILALIRGR